MKSVGGFLRNVVQRKEGGLVGRTFKVGIYTVRVEAHLGDGGFATIYRVRDTASGSAFALKHMRMGAEPDALADCHTEVETMQRLRDHPNILTLRALAFVGPKGAEQEAFLLLDLCRESLVDHMRAAGGPLPDADVLTIFHSVCKAVAIMHHQSPPLSHRDLKAENVLLHNNGTWVLCDFGSTTSWSGRYEGSNAIMMAEEHVRKYTTAAYRAPEMFDLYSRELIDTKADMWALGVLLYYICFQQLPFLGDCKLQVLNGDYNLPPGRPEPLLDLIRGLLKVSPAQRLDIDAVLHRLERMSSKLSIRAASSGPPSVPSRATSNGNAARMPRTSAGAGAGATKEAGSSSQAVSGNGVFPAPSASGGGSWDAGGWDAGSWAQIPSSTNQSAPPPSIFTKEVYPTISPRQESAGRPRDAAEHGGEELAGLPAIAKPPQEPKPLTPARPSALAPPAPPKLQLSSPALQQSSSLKALGGTSGNGGGLDLMDAPAQLHSRSLDGGMSSRSLGSADVGGTGSGRRDSGGSEAAAGTAALQQQVAELSEAKRRLTAENRQKDALIEQLQAELQRIKSLGEDPASDAQKSSSANSSQSSAGQTGWVASFGDRHESLAPQLSGAAARVQQGGRNASPQPPLRRTTSPWKGSEGASEPATLSPDHPLKSLEQSLSQLDPFASTTEPLTASPAEPAAQSTPLKKGPSRLGMKLRGASFEAFEDIEPVPGDAGHISPAADAAPGSGLPASSKAEHGSEKAPGKKSKGPRHRRTTSEPTPIESWQPRTEWA